MYPPQVVPTGGAMPLSDIEIKKMQPKDKLYRVKDSDKLYIEVKPNGKKTWRLRLKIGGKENMISLGSYPEVKLKDARAKRDEFNVQRSKGENPLEARIKQAAISKIGGATFGNVYNEWIEKQRNVWSDTHYDKAVCRVRNHLLPRLGHLELKDISSAMVLDALRVVEKNGTLETAHRLMGICSQIFRVVIQT